MVPKFENGLRIPLVGVSGCLFGPNGRSERNERNEGIPVGVEGVHDVRPEGLSEPMEEETRGDNSSDTIVKLRRG